ncbi:hypothetical protein [Streptomyces kanamyceticus]|uniref:hypothetical protein n=1 Tax=Streptomyces kanamyceticus TaxID=1967 RepID=UPI0037DD04D7
MERCRLPGHWRAQRSAPDLRRRATHLAELGHLGPMDVVLNMDRLLATGELDPGQHVLVLSNSPVAAWTVTLWEV